MSRSSAADRIPAEYYILRPQARGRVIGYLSAQPIAETVVDQWGRQYRYRGLAPRRRDGRLDVGSLRSGEWIVEPGLVYSAEPVLPRRRR